MIQNFYIISKTGDLIYHKDYQERKVNPSLLSGFISAISHFADAIGEGDIKNMVIANQVWFYVTEKNLIVLCIADQTDSEEYIKDLFLIPLLRQFLNDYGDLLNAHIMDISAFEGFGSHVDHQNEEYSKQSEEKSSKLLITQAISINGAIEMFGLDNLALILRHTANHRLVLLGDELLIKRVGALVQSMIPINISPKIDKYTDLFLTTTYPDKVSIEVEISTFNLTNKGWINSIYKKAEYEKSIIKDILKKKNLGDMDQILVFRNNYMESLDITREYIDAVWKYGDLPYLEKQLQQILKNKNFTEFLHGHIKKNVGLDIDRLIKESK